MTSDNGDNRALRAIVWLLSPREWVRSFELWFFGPPNPGDPHADQSGLFK